MFKEYDASTYKEKKIKDRTPFRNDLKRLWNSAKFWRCIVLLILIVIVGFCSNCLQVHAAEYEESVETPIESIIITDEEFFEETTISEELESTGDVSSEMEDTSSEFVNETDMQVVLYLEKIVLTLQGILVFNTIILFFLIAEWTTEKIKNMVRRFLRNE